MAYDVSSPDQTGQYTWFLFGDLAVGNTGARVWQSGPDKEEPRAPLHVLMNEGSKFHLLDAHGDVRFEGYIVGDFGGSEPLEDYGHAHGCVAIQWDQHDGRG